MFKELGSRFKTGTVNLTVTMHEGQMSVMVTFKGLPPEFTPRVIKGTPAEIEEHFFSGLEEPLSMVSAYNSKMKELEEVLKKNLEEKKKEVEKAGKTDTKKADTKKTAPKQEELITAPKKEEAVKEKPEPEQPKPVKLTEEQKQEIIKVASAEDPFEARDLAIAKLMEIKSIDKKTATEYFDNNLKVLLDEAISKAIQLADQHTKNVEAMKADAKKQSEDEFDPFASDDDDFNL